jgi:hypothetical protein
MAENFEKMKDQHKRLLHSFTAVKAWKLDMQLLFPGIQKKLGILWAEKER